MEEIRQQKALALLEQKEARDQVEAIQNSLRHHGVRLRGIGATVEERPHAVDTTELREVADLVIDLIGKFASASTALHNADAKCKEFGL